MICSLRCDSARLVPQVDLEAHEDAEHDDHEVDGNGRPVLGADVLDDAAEYHGSPMRRLNALMCRKVLGASASPSRHDGPVRFVLRYGLGLIPNCTHSTRSVNAVPISSGVKTQCP